MLFFDTFHDKWTLFSQEFMDLFIYRQFTDTCFGSVIIRSVISEVKYHINAEKPLSTVGPHIKITHTAKRKKIMNHVHSKSIMTLRWKHFYYSVWDDAKLFKLLSDFPFDWVLKKSLYIISRKEMRHDFFSCKDACLSIILILEFNCYESIYWLYLHCQDDNLDLVKIFNDTFVQIGNRDFKVKFISDSSVWDCIGINVHWAVHFCLTGDRLFMSFYVYNSWFRDLMVPMLMKREGILNRDHGHSTET